MKKPLIKYTAVELFQQDVRVLKNINTEINSGDFFYLLGKVGCGKSSFLKSLYAEIPVESGEASVLNYDMRKIKKKEIPLLRRKIGIVFQDFQLLHDRSINKNLEFVLRATGWKDKTQIADQISSVLQRVGMENKGYKMPHQLSGGEQQRIVIARSLLNSPELILADEPTGNLDPETGRGVVELLLEICKSGTTVIMATHNLLWPENYSGHILFFENETITDMGNS
ncbi:MAG: ATP-binding cassette domain-containing protein [Paludibacter sp.]|jgi:cell division transport system ATP-binding protein|nr:ATP-binding cassette domain-containing protein [Paludibacter sp.]